MACELLGLPGFPFVKGATNFIVRDEALSRTWGCRFGRIFANLRKKCIPRGILHTRRYTFAFMLTDKWFELRAVVNFASEIFKESLLQNSIRLSNTACANYQEFAAEQAPVLALSSP